LQADCPKALVHVVVKIARNPAPFFVLDREQFPGQRADIISISVFGLLFSSRLDMLCGLSSDLV
jgi:hypothetical protein